MIKDLPVKSLKKALDILDLLLFRAGAEGLSLSAIAQALGLPANTAHNLLKTMIACDYAEQTDGSRYRAGGKWRQASRLHHLLAREPVFRALRETAQRIGESCVLATLANGDRLVIGRAEGDRAVQVAAAVIDAGRLYNSPTGRVLVAFADPGERRSIVARHGLPGERWDGIDDAAGLDAAAEDIRAAGGCRILTQELAAVAVPVLGPEGDLLGALGAYAPRFRCPLKRQGVLLRELRKSAVAMSQL
jgi:DNA-binding IclR family transcriptional regulator